MSRSRSFASLAIGGAALALAATSSSAATFSDFPNIGNNTSGAAILITLGSGGATLATNPTNSQPYEGIEDAYIGVWNNTNVTVTTIGLTGNNIFGFELDGIGAGPYPNPCTTSSSCSPVSGVDNTNGYGGPLSNFTVTDANNGFVNFTGGLAPGAITWFALENSPSGANLQITQVGNTPIPAALPLFAGGLGVMGLLARRRKKAKA
jgi:hypothetical protein